MAVTEEELKDPTLGSSIPREGEDDSEVLDYLWNCKNDHERSVLCNKKNP
jgi:hypothetical protein